MLSAETENRTQQRSPVSFFHVLCIICQPEREYCQGWNIQNFQLTGNGTEWTSGQERKHHKNEKRL